MATFIRSIGMMWLKSQFQGQSQWGALQSVWETNFACQLFFLFFCKAFGNSLSLSYYPCWRLATAGVLRGFRQNYMLRVWGSLSSTKSGWVGWQQSISTLINNQFSSARRKSAPFATRTLELIFSHNITGEITEEQPIKQKKYIYFFMTLVDCSSTNHTFFYCSYWCIPSVVTVLRFLWSLHQNVLSPFLPILVNTLYVCFSFSPSKPFHSFPGFGYTRVIFVCNQRGKWASMKY